MNDKKIVKIWNNQSISITWKSFDKINYYTDSLYYGDLGVFHHTNIMMNDFIQDLIEKIPDCTFCVNHQITKPLSLKKVIM